MKGSPPMPAQSTKNTLIRAFTLVEVMVSAMILSMSTIGLTGLFLQNMKYSKWQVRNVQVANSAFGVADQIKNIGSSDLFKLYQDPTNNETINVTVADPTDTTDGYKVINLKINQKDVNVTNSAWNTTLLRTGRNATDPTVAVDYWITIRRNRSVANETPVRDILELTLIYRWSVGATKTKTINQIQLAFPAVNCTFN